MRTASSSTWNAQQGVTLIELMVGLFVSLIVVAAGFVVLTTTEKATRANEQTVDTQQNVRIAMELIARDIKVAGFGMLPPPNTPVGTCSIGGNAAAIVPLDQTPGGADTGADQIRLLVPLGNSVAPAWTLTNATGGVAGFTQIALPGTPAPGAVQNMVSAGLAVGSMISIGGAVTTTVTSVNVGGNTINFTGTNAIPGPTAFGVGAPVYILQCVTYDVGTTTALCGGGNSPCLRRNGISIAEGIEDIQFEYACDGCVSAVNGGIVDGIVDNQGGAAGYDAPDFVMNNTWATSPMTPDKIRLVKIFIVARQEAADQGLGEKQVAGVQTQTALVVSDHNHSADAGFNLATYQQFRRRVLTKTVETRNTGL